MVKVYELARYDAMTVRINYLGQTVIANFRGGNRLNTHAKLTTADIFVQDAIEHDRRFGTLFTLVRKYEDTPAAAAQAAKAVAAPKKVSKVKTVNDALLYFTKLGATVTTENDLEGLMEKYNVVFPNLRR